MAGSSKRFGHFLKSSVNALLQPAEDPRKSDIGPEQEQLMVLAQVRGATVRLSETRERLELQRTGVAESIGALDEDARNALRAGQEELARLALQRQRVGNAELGQLDRQIAGLRREEDRLTGISQRVSAQIEAMRAREQMAAARHSAARAQVAVGEALSGIGSLPSDPGLIAQIERDADDLQARADAIEELTEAGIFGHDGVFLTKQHESGLTEATDDEIEARLRQLKDELVVRS